MIYDAASSGAAAGSGLPNCSGELHLTFRLMWQTWAHRRNSLQRGFKACNFELCRAVRSVGPTLLMFGEHENTIWMRPAFCDVTVSGRRSGAPPLCPAVTHDGPETLGKR